MAKQHTINVGQTIDILLGEELTGVKKYIGASQGYLRLTYAGMPNDQTFSIGTYVLDGTGNAYKYGINFFYPANMKPIHIKGSEFNVHKVTPEQLILEYIGKNK